MSASHRVVLDVSGLPTASVGRDAAALLDAVAQAHLLFCSCSSSSSATPFDVAAPSPTFAVADLRTDKPLEAHLRSITERRRAALRES
jgi:hypothetical protein